MITLNGPKYCRILPFNTIQSNINNKIWICSTSFLKITILVDEEQLVHCKISTTNGSFSSQATFVYAKCTRRERDTICGIASIV